ncbi:N-acetylneuraminate synthase family protein [Desulfovibrio sp. JC010]|uniref:N-acetylneuraminate synthase family protein n=1 Tax=Desulfovibrio sp. JC010 TaxID=2593641 RepID=UPI0013D535ED|nr:N-acetylneuraminate synthase family protein [Desulfovibrio sp. JC010]NDV26704.1 N-acetylneuraminate synthase [Desulfovibrio sp. JC010]
MKNKLHFEIEDRKSGPVYLIAEIGINHGGDYALALETIDAAVGAGADAVKFQSFKADEFMSDKDLLYSYEENGVVVRESMYDMFKRLELPVEWHMDLKNYAESKGVDFLSSAADKASANLLVEMGVSAIKLASEDLINYPLLKHIATLGQPVILSTGMAEEWEIEKALDELAAVDVMLLHCVSLYPTPLNQGNLLRIKSLKKKFGKVVGYSDHTMGIEAAELAVALGAVCVEKHFTLDRTLPGPDHSFSCTPDELKELRVRLDRAVDMLGNGAFAPGEEECKARLDFRRSIVAARPLKAGTVLSEDDLHLQRPHTGIHPVEMEKLVGRKLSVDVEEREQLSWNFLADDLRNGQL